MTRLSIHPEQDASTSLLASDDRGQIASELALRGVQFSHPGVAEAGVHDEGTDVLATYAELVTRERDAHGYASIDVVSVSPSTPNLAALRQKFLSEHTHVENEARFMVEGAGAFYLRCGGEVLILELTAGDLISVPDGTRHWFDMGAQPRFTAIRFFTRPDGWVGSFTGDPIAERFPLYAGPA
jgi:1,2-dihydroxy-3-keto-5-methylthiopentene dioxygenase